MIQGVKKLLIRDLNKLKKEVELYSKEENLWIVSHDISNCAGNLCLHLIGNLNAFVGEVFGKTGYVRQRDLEFSTKNVPRVELLEQIDQTIQVVDDSMDKVTVEQLEEEFPHKIEGEPLKNKYMLMHLTTHLAYHLGQVNYHRRLLDK